MPVIKQYPAVTRAIINTTAIKLQCLFTLSPESDEDEQIKRLPPQPPIKTMTYTVRDRDTLTSLAARFDTTPSELTKLNRLATQFIFPGQTLLVPDKRKVCSANKSYKSSRDGQRANAVAPPIAVHCAEFLF
ncbi:hypothetical protein RR46_10733 [Papilio xuthus]|uniref:LysM domain-containing protein n=1 Tax=Papilio xuthus TaxID=66420 RepID=A0A194PKD8_PAPXU|nr:hypothetical protein RR46_10733 [Papilio xuthus]